MTDIPKGVQTAGPKRNVCQRCAGAGRVCNRCGLSGLACPCDGGDVPAKRCPACNGFGTADGRPVGVREPHGGHARPVRKPYAGSAKLRKQVGSNR